MKTDELFYVIFRLQLESCQLVSGLLGKFPKTKLSYEQVTMKNFKDTRQNVRYLSSPMWMRGVYKLDYKPRFAQCVTDWRTEFRYLGMYASTTAQFMSLEKDEMNSNCLLHWKN